MIKLKTISLVLVLLMLASTFAACMPKRKPNPEKITDEIKQPESEDTQDPQENHDFVFQLNQDGTGYMLIDAPVLEIGTQLDIVIPDTYKGLPVTEIATTAFEHSSIRSLVIPGSITTIPDNAFTDCKSLTKLTLGEGTISIGRFAFSMSPITEVSLPDSLTTLGEGAFYGCKSLETVRFGTGLVLVETDAFSMTEAMKNVHIPSLDSYLKIEFRSPSASPFNSSQSASLFIGGVAGASVLTIPETVTSIPAYAFYNCKSIYGVSIPETVTHIGEHAFAQSSITELTIPDSVTKIGEEAFWSCKQLKSVTLGNGITTIAPFTFAGCEGLKEVTFGTSVKTIGESAFYYCDAIEKVTYYGTQAEWDSIEKPGAFPFPYAQINPTEEPTWSEWETITAATCTTEGLRRRMSDKGDVEEEVIPPLDHVSVVDSAVTPTCQQTGLTAGSHCSRCNTKLIEQQIVPVTDHAYVNGVCKHCQAPQPAAAWDGTVDTSWYNENQSTFTITTAEQLAGLAKLVNDSYKDFDEKTIKLAADLNLNNLPWTPIGYTRTFCGTFDGQNHTISNMTITHTYGDLGLFGCSRGVIKNLTLTNVDVRPVSLSTAGTLLGSNEGEDWSQTYGTVSNCHVSGTMTITTMSTNQQVYVGGLIGYLGIDSIVENSSSNVTISVVTCEEDSNQTIRVGGLIASAESPITYCYASGDITVTATYASIYAGGLVGQGSSASETKYSYATGDVTAYTVSKPVYAGGLFGQLTGPLGGAVVLKNCYATGNVSATSNGANSNNKAYAGGLVGAGRSIAFVQCYTTGNVSAAVGEQSYTYGNAYAGSLIGGIINGENNSSYHNCYYTAEQTRTATAASETNAHTLIDGTAQYLSTIQTQSFYTDTLGWSSDIWNFENGQHPTLK